MTTSLLVAEAELSRQLGDYWSSTTDGAGSSTTLVDSALMAKANDWITDNCWAFLIEEPAGAAAIYDERKISSLDNTSGTLTTLAFGAAPGTGIDYEVHRMFSPSEKRRALIYACRASFPHIVEEIRDQSLVSGNWLKDGSLEKWTSSSALTYWTASAVTVAQTTTLPYYKHGSTSAKLDTAAGFIYQDIALWGDLQRLAGKTVTFSGQGWCDTASCLRLAILYDGTNLTYSDYHDGDSAWTEDEPNDDSFYVQYTIDDNPTDIEFRVYHAVAAGTSYVDDLRVTGPDGNRIYLGDKGLFRNTPHQVLIEPNNYSSKEPWTLIHNITFDRQNGYMYLPDSVSKDYRLRVLGIGYLDFLASGVSSTAWTATVDIDQPQLDILIAQAILYLYTEMSMPNFSVGDRSQYQNMIGFWKQELRERVGKYGMEVPSATSSWG